MMQKKYQDAFLKHFQLSVQRMLPFVHNLSTWLKNDEMLIRMEAVNATDDMFNNFLRDSTKGLPK